MRIYLIEHTWDGDNIPKVSNQAYSDVVDAFRVVEEKTHKKQTSWPNPWMCECVDNGKHTYKIIEVEVV